MRRLNVVLVLLAAVLAAWSSAFAQGGGNNEVLTNESIVKLVQSGIGSSLIVKMISDQPADFHMGSANVIQLKQKGVPQSVLSAMLSKRSGAGDSSGGGAPAGNKAVAAPGAVTPNYTWIAMNKTDPITGKGTFAVVVDTPGLDEDGGRRQGTLEAIATCDRAATTLKVVFISDEKPGIGFKQNTETYMVSGGLLGGLQMASHHQKAWTVTRVRVGSGEGRQVTSEDDYKNASEVYFTVPQPRDEPANQDEAGMRALLQFASFIGPNKPAGETEELFGAKTVLLEMELENGVKTLLTLHPQGEVFQSFADRCRKLAPEPTAVASAGARAEIRPPDRSGAGSSSGAGAGSSAVVPRTGAPPPRPMIPAGARLTMAVLEAFDMNALHAGKLVRATLTQPMQLPVQAGAQPAPAMVQMGPGTEVYLRCGAAAGTGDRMNVRLELDHAVVNGTTIALQSEMQMRQVSRGITLPSGPVKVGSYGTFRIPQSRMPADPVLVKEKEQLSFSTSQVAYAGPGYKP